MRNQLVTLCAVLLAAGCGVNPDRLATMHERSADRAETTTKSSETVEDERPPLEFDDSDPAEVREAIMGLQDLDKLVKKRQYRDYLTARSDLMRSVSFEASESIATSAKTPLIIDYVYELDKQIAEVAGGDAQTNFASVGRADVASSDALYSLKEAFEACSTALGAENEEARSAAWTKYESALARAKAVDTKAMTFVGKRVTGDGYVDVPVEYAVCEASMAVAKAEAADMPAPEESMAKTTEGCGFYPVDVEAKQTGPNKFGDYLITSAYIADVDPGAAQPVDCAAIPPVSDAETPVRKVVEEFVAWLKPGDIISMGGSFKYTGPEGQKLKVGTARIYRRDATLKTTACGVDSKKISCEAEGSILATAYNHANHYLKRAEYHRAQGNAEQCQKMAESALKAASVTSPEGTDMKFQVAGKKQFTRAEIVAQIDGSKKKAQEAMTGDWCATK